MTYAETIHSLFTLLAQCNAADSHEKRDWQKPIDANRRNGMYGSIREAIVALAGEAIVAHWANCGELEMLLADRIGLAE